VDKLANGTPLTNMFDETILHEHVCKNCSVKFYCSLPDCDGGCCDPELCPLCQEALDGIW